MRTLVFAIALSVTAIAQTDSDINFTASIGELRDLRQQLSRYLLAETERSLSSRPRPTDEASMRKRGAQVREQILRNLGSFPERTPLNAKVVGIVDRPAYRIEKIVFESQPQFYVTANLYLPK